MDEPTLPLHYFVYYRVRDDIDADDAHATVRAMQAALARRTGVEGRLMVQVHDDITWMEIYPGIDHPEAFEAALEEAATAHDVAALVAPGAARHLERFTECV